MRPHSVYTLAGCRAGSPGRPFRPSHSVLTLLDISLSRGGLIMGLSFSQLHPLFAAEASPVDLRQATRRGDSSLRSAPG